MGWSKTFLLVEILKRVLNNMGKKVEKNPQQIKNRGGVSRKKLEKVDLRIRNQIKKGGDITIFSHKTRVPSRFYLVVCLYPWRTHLLIGSLSPKKSINHGSRKFISKNSPKQ